MYRFTIALFIAYAEVRLQTYVTCIHYVPLNLPAYELCGLYVH